MKQHPDEPDVVNLPNAIAVIGMAGRFPGARNLDEFRRNLENGVECITVFSDEELLRAGVDRKLLADPNYVKAAPLLEDAANFDAAFFEYSPREAMIMDPQQRLFLECAWEALEDAGHAGDASGSATGVFAGGGGIMSTYLLSDRHFNPQLTGTTASMQHVGNDKDYLSSRVSYKLNLKGPSFAILSACSTSLVSIHVACQSLLNRECDMALAGGTTVRVPQRAGYLYKEGNVFSRDGHCRAFDAEATGTVFGSGIGVVVLKRLKDALADGDAIRAVIRGTAINNDGSEDKISYWAPHADGQARAMRRALEVAQVDPRTIGYVEAHGTATKKGDPTEIRALTQAFGTLPPGSCAIGSVKSNIGHPESAAGVAGLIKAVLSLEHDVLFPSLHYARPNPEVDFPHGFEVNASRRPWPERPYPRRAAVNALGIGGTNAFAILEQAPPRPMAPATEDRSCHVLTLSAKTPEALEALAARFKTHLEQRPSESFPDVCYTANVGRSHFVHRVAIAASTAEEALAQLAASDAAGQAHHGHVGETAPRIAFLFTGQGSQYVNMAQELYRTHAGFRRLFDECAERVSSHLERSLTSVVYPHAGGRSPIDQTSYTQPALFAIEYALATLWRSWGVQPSVLVGHSIGEIVAACVAGVMSLDDALRLTAARGRLMQALPRDGGMAAVRCDPARAAEAVAPYRDHVSIAAINGPGDVVISGRLEQLEAIVSGLEREGIVATRLNVSHAFHSPLMEPMLAEFRMVAESVTYAPPSIPIVSNVTGQLVAPEEITTADYWVRHVREAVRFADGISAAHAHGVDLFLEVGPAPVLLGLTRQSLPRTAQALVPSLRAGRSDWRQLAEALAALYVNGVRIDWSAVDREYRRQRLHLPTYPFQSKPYWMDPPPISALAASAETHGSLLGQRLRLPGSPEIRFEARWTPQAPAYLDDHRIFDTVVVPGASHVAMTLAAMREVTRQDTCVLEDVVFPQALTLPEDGARTAQLVMKKDGDGKMSFQVLTLRENEDPDESSSWVTHATGRIEQTATSHDPAPATARIDQWQRRCARQAQGAFYDRFWEAGYHLRGAFRWIANTWAGDREVLCELQWPDLTDATEYPLYPSLIDSCFQSVFSDTASEVLREGAVYVPFSIRRFELLGPPVPGARLWCHVSLAPSDSTARSGVHADIMLCEDTGRVIARIEDCQLREIRREALLQELGKDLSDSLYEVQWQTQPRPSVAPETRDPGLWVIFADDQSSVGDKLVRHLQGVKQRCVRVSAGDRYRQLAPDHYEIDALSSEDVRRVLEDVSAPGAPPCRGIVHLWSLDTAPVNGRESRASHDQVGASVLHVVQAIAKLEWSDTPRLWLVTCGAQPVEPLPNLAVQQAPLWGLGRIIALEHPELACVRVDLDPAQGSDDAERLFAEVWTPDEQDQLAFRRGVRYVPRLVRSTVLTGGTAEGQAAADSGPFQVRLSSYGQLDNLTTGPLTRRAPGPGDVEIEVRATGLNFRDVLIGLGLLEEHYATHLGVTSASDMTFGFECAGKVVAVGDGVSNVAPGDEVVALACHGALGSFVTLPHEFVVSKPAAWSFEEAATVPLAFLTAYYGLDRLAHLRRGERVLIHAAAGGVGQACVQWARHVGAEVFATASPAKWEFLKSNGVEHVMSSRTLDFAAEIMAQTGGAGVDVVINTLSGEFVDRSFEVLRQGGRFVELGKRDVWSPEQARERRPDVAYFPFDLVEVAQRDPGAIGAMLAEMRKQVDAGTVTPLPHTVFPASKVVDAFRYMAEARHIGKIVVAMPPRAAADDASRGIRENATYLVTGGLGALGLEIAKRLVEEGARHIVLSSRRPAGADALQAIEQLRAAGVNVLVHEADVADPSQVARMLQAIDASLPPLRGIVHAAGLLDDGVLLQQTWARFRKVMAPKVDGAWNLHALTAKMPLDFFVCFSSIASLAGNAGQANYAAGNAFMDALAHQRRASGLPALSINWGPWDEVGMAATGDGQRQRRLSGQGFRAIAPDQGVEIFSRLLRSPAAQVGVAPVNWSEFLRMNPAGRPFFEKVAKPEVTAPAREANLRKQLEEAADPRALLLQHVRAAVSRVLGMQNPGDIDPRARLFDLGLESLMAVELRGRFEESLGCSLRPTLLFDYPTVESLADHLAGKVLERAEPPVAVAAALAAAPAPPAEDFQGLDEDEIADRLAEELAAMSRPRVP